jgi:hypothetical protein
MRKRANFDSYRAEGWPDPEWLKKFFLAPKGQQWSFFGGNDNWGLAAEGAEGTEHFGPTDPRRININLSLWGNRELGVLLIYKKWGGGHNETHDSKGNLLRLKEHGRDLHGTRLPIGLFIPFEKAWLAVKEFIETDGKLPKSIDWIEDSKLPADTFPPP